MNESDYPKQLDPKYQELWDAAVRCLRENHMRNDPAKSASAQAALASYAESMRK